jgi:hypothetical protein
MKSVPLRERVVPAVNAPVECLTHPLMQLALTITD